MPIEHVSRTVSFDNLCVEVTIVRFICEWCNRREAFHDTPTPYGETVPTPQSRGWQIVHQFEDGDQGAKCPQCVADDVKRKK